jgi:multiple sugar transport system ATP-binding protein
MSDLSLSGVRKSFGAVDIIRGVDLEVENGEFVVFVGPSGCGKSTLLRMIAGLEDVSDGEIRIGGRLANDLAPRDRGVAMVFQSYALYPHMSVYDNVGYSLKLAKVDKGLRDRKIREAARILQMEHLLERKPGQLSGGQRQRVAIGRAIVREPDVFLFDEPLSNLDAALRVDMRTELLRLHQDLGATMIYVTHDQVEAMTMADKIVVLDGGVVQQVGTPLELYNRPANLFVAGFIGAPKMNFFDITAIRIDAEAVVVAGPDVAETAIVLAKGRPQSGQKLKLGVRPHHLVPKHGGPIAGVVRLVERLGNETLATVETATGTIATVSLDGRSDVAVGLTLELQIAPGEAIVFGEDGRAL